MKDSRTDLVVENKVLKQNFSEAYLYKILSSLFLQAPCV
jgi:hypothetical protein